MEMIFEKLSIVELIMLGLFVEGVVLVILAKLIFLIARKMKLMSQEKYDLKKLKLSQKSWFFRYKPVWYAVIILAIPLSVGFKFKYQPNVTTHLWHQGPSDAFQAELDEKIIQFIKQKNIPQLCLGVQFAAGRYMSCANQLSLNEDRELDNKSIFEIGSITKTFTATAMIHVLKKHSIDIHSAIAPYLPITLAQLNPGLAKVTWKQLSTHTSGLSNMPFGLNWISVKSIFNGMIMKNNAAALSTDYILSYLETAKLAKDANNNPSYSNLGAGLLGFLLSNIENKSYQQLIHDEVVKPLNLERTAASAEISGKRAQGYGQYRTIGDIQVTGNAEFMQFSDAMAGAGAVNSNLDDMMKYLNHGIASYQSPIYQNGQYTADFTKRTQINLGWFVSKIDLDLEQRVVWHNGGTAGFRSYTGFSESGDVGVVVLSTGTKTVDSLAESILTKLMYDSANKAVEPGLASL